MWMPLGTKIIYCIFIKYRNTMDYIDVVVINLFPVVQKLSAGPE